MARQIERSFNTFVRGLITEASELNFPENASLDEDNFVLERTGKRRRRKGLDYEPSYGLIASTFTADELKTANISLFKWNNPGGNPSLSIGILRVRNKLWYLDLTAANPSNTLLNNGVPFTVPNLNNTDIEGTVINNLFVIVGEELSSTIVLTYNNNNGFVFAEEIPLMVRDIWGVDDELDVSDRPTTLTDTHAYNLRNQGWNPNIKHTGSGGSTAGNNLNYYPRPFVTTTTGFDSISIGDAPTESASFYNTWIDNPGVNYFYQTASVLSRFRTDEGIYPSNSDLWTLGKIADVTSANYNLFDSDVLLRNSMDSLYVPRGAYVLDAYNRGSWRIKAMGLTTSPGSWPPAVLPSDLEQGRCTSVATYASRVFYSGIQSQVTNGDVRSPNYSGYIFFSQVVTNKEKLSMCFQEADPTSPDISDLIETDGGTIQIPEASKITKLVPALGSLLVFAENGVWEIYGDTGGFTATSFQLHKVSSIGVENKNAIVEAGGNVYAWTNSGILVYTQDELSARFKAQSISEATIQSFYDTISNEAIENAKGFFDKEGNTIRWLYNSNDVSTEYTANTGLYRYNKELILDLTLNAFYPFTINHAVDASMPSIHGYVSLSQFAPNSLEETVVVGSDTVIVVSLDEVTSLESVATDSDSFKYITTTGTNITLSLYSNESYRDWFTFNSSGYGTVSYIVTGYDIAGDIFRDKYSPFFFTYIEKTEDGFLDNAGTLEPTNQSSCLFQAQWDWHNTSSGGKWSVERQSYRLKPYTPENINDVYDDGQDLVVTRNKVRGSGKSLSIKLYSEGDKHLNIVGWGYDFVSIDFK